MNIFLAFCGVDQEGLGNGGGEGGEEEDGSDGGFEEHVGWCLGSDGRNCFLLSVSRGVKDQGEPRTSCGI